MPNPGARHLAVAAESLYLANLMLAPGLAFVLLLVLYWRRRHSADALALNHLSQTVGVSLLGGGLIGVGGVLLALFGGTESGYTWMMVVLYFTFVNSSLILFGVIGLVRAMAGRRYVYPLLGGLFRS